MNEESAGKQTVTVEIAGERHTLRAGVSPDYTRRVAAHVDETIRSVGPAGGLEFHRTVMLAALTITDQLFRARRELGRLQDEVRERSGLCARRLEGAVEEAEEE
ncbi:MAG: cell division protein ZapA [Longimicrobiaceae bacterium]